MQKVVVLLFLNVLGYKVFCGDHPNILFIMTDDQSWPHAGAYGSDWIKTPNFDRLAGEGVLFQNAFASAPSCAPSRLSVLTGRHFFHNQEGAIHGGFIPNKFPLFTFILEENGYHVGYTGKGCGPFHKAKDQAVALKKDPYGKQYNQKKLDSMPIHSWGNLDYVENFKDFLNERKRGQPFCFSYNSWEPHRPYLDSAAFRNGYPVNSVQTLPLMPDIPRIRSDIAEYAFEINYFDQTLDEFISILKTEGLYDNTIIVVTSDNGMPFPNAKMHSYEYGHHVPLLVVFPGKYPKGKKVDDLVLIPQLAPTLLKETGCPVPCSMTMNDLQDVLIGRNKEESSQEFVIWGKEKHNPARENNMGYPVRALRTQKYLYMHNFEPDRWPAGDPPYFLDFIWEGGQIPELAMRFEMENKNHPVIGGYFRWHTEKRPESELFDIVNDPFCLFNLAPDPAFNETVQLMKAQLFGELKRQKDPRVLGEGEMFDSVPTAFVNPKNADGNPVFNNFPGKGEYVKGMKRFNHDNDREEARELKKPK